MEEWKKERNIVITVIKIRSLGLVSIGSKVQGCMFVWNIYWFNVWTTAQDLNSINELVLLSAAKT